MISAKQMYRNAAAVHLPIGFKGMLKMKKAISLLMLCAVLVCCCGCNRNPFAKHPYLYGDSVWLCENPKITYVVEMKYDDEQEMDMPQTYAVTNVDGKEILFDFDYLYENIIAYKVSDSDSNDFEGTELFHGIGKYSKTKFTIKVDTETDNLFDGQYDELVFVRQEDEQAD